MLSTHFELKIWGQFVYTGVSFLKHRPVYSVNSYLCFFLLRPPHHPPLVCISFSGHLGGQKILQFFPLCLDLLCLVPCIPAGGGLAGTDMSSLVLSLPSLAKQRKENRERERTETGQEEHSQKEKWGGGQDINSKNKGTLQKLSVLLFVYFGWCTCPGRTRPLNIQRLTFMEMTTASLQPHL